MIDFHSLLGDNLNMFNSTEATDKGKLSRSTILQTALELFRTRGFDQTKMRDIAQAADVALGAAYYYFPSKDAIVQSYYDFVHTQHVARVHAALADRELSLRERLGVAFHAKLDILANDQKLLGTIFRYTGEPDHPLSCFGSSTQATRQNSIALFADVLAVESLPDDLREFLPIAFWGLHMAMLLFFIYDRSPEQQRTRKFVDGVLDLVVSLLAITKSPLLKPFRGKLFSLLRDVDLLPLASAALGSQPREESL
jgi:AcrR family transcriptional regulator